MAELQFGTRKLWQTMLKKHFKQWNECHKELFILKVNPGVVFSGRTKAGKISQEPVLEIQAV